MAVNKVEFGDEVIMDITDSTVTEENLLEDEVAYGPDGKKVVGILSILAESVNEDQFKIDEDKKLNLSDKVVNDFNALSEKVVEIELFKFPNAIIHGDPTINNGQISGFSSNDYLSLPFVFDVTDRSFEWHIAFTTSDNVTQPQNLIGSNFCIALLIENAKLKFRASNNGSTWNVADIESNVDLQTSTTYYLKIVFDKLSYKMLLSTNNKDFEQVGYLVSTLTPRHGQLNFGIGNNGHNPFKGIINFNKLELLENNVIIWEGMDDVGLASRMATDMENIDEAGIEKVKQIAKSSVDMYKNLSELPKDEDGFIDIPSDDEHVLSAHVITEISNKKTYRVIVDALVTEQGGTGIGTWCADINNYSASDSADWIGARTGEEDISNLLKISDNDDDISVEFLFEADNNEPIYNGGYQIDTTLGRLCIKFGNTITKNNKVGIDITRLTRMK